MGQTMTTRAAVTLAVIAGLSGGLSPAAAQEIPCKDSAEFPCGFEVEQISLEKAPALFSLQARIAQAKLPLGKASFQTIVVNVLDGAQIICMEQINKVDVEQSMLNLTIGQNMSCDLSEAIAERPNLAFQVCLGSSSNCLKPIELSTTPYAVTATYASLAQQAAKANVAGQANYAQRATADRTLLLQKKLETGYFDFYTHEYTWASDVYPTEGEYQTYEDGGFIQWTPVGDPGTRNLHIAGKSVATDRLQALDELVLASAKTTVSGDLTISPPADGAGLIVTSGGLHLTGSSVFHDGLLLTGATTANGELGVTGDTSILGSLLVAGPTTVQSGGLHVTGASDIGGGLTIEGGLTVQSGLQVTGDVTVDGLLKVKDLQVTGALSVLGGATFATLSAGTATIDDSLLAASAAVSGAAAVGGTMQVAGQMTVDGPSVFDEHVVFATSAPESEGPDARYLLATGEDRDLTLGSHASFQGVKLIGDLDLSGSQLVNARFQASGAPPVPCTQAIEGYFYLDTAKEKLLFCIDGTYQSVGGDVCGNANVEPDEGCDDGNLAADDGCSPSCAVETPGWSCSAKTVQPTACAPVCSDGWIRGTETCDDNNLANSDGCSSVCQLEAGWTCTGEPTACETICGDGLIKGGETCDDGNTTPGDGCNATCTTETDWTCIGQPSACVPAVCGDNKITGLETCDDGNLSAGDGCGADCMTETGWVCNGVPSVCQKCGNGKKEGTELCDDGNLNNTDGCNSTCGVESGWTCNGVTPSVCQKCGNAKKEGTEGCDDGNLTSGDGCNGLCTIEANWQCTGSPSTCWSCGNGKKETAEACDDGNKTGYDGCNSSCQIEAGWQCSGTAPSSCVFRPNGNTCSIKKWNGKPYGYCTTNRTWDQASAACNSAGWMLVNVNDSSERDFLNTFNGGLNIWIGLKWNGGMWVMPTQGGSTQPAYYFDWAANEPNGFDINEHCVHMASWVGEKWNDNSCGASFYFVCEPY